MARQASRSLRVASRSTKTGMKVADSTPPEDDVVEHVGGGVGQVVGVASWVEPEGEGQGQDPQHAGQPGEAGAGGHAHRGPAQAARSPPAPRIAAALAAWRLAGRRLEVRRTAAHRRPESRRVGRGPVARHGPRARPRRACEPGGDRQVRRPPAQQHHRAASGQDDPDDRGGGGADRELPWAITRSPSGAGRRSTWIGQVPRGPGLHLEAERRWSGGRSPAWRVAAAWGNSSLSLDTLSVPTTV